jgi:hypothetical protein
VTPRAKGKPVEVGSWKEVVAAIKSGSGVVVSVDASVLPPILVALAFDDEDAPRKRKKHKRDALLLDLVRDKDEEPR